MHTDPVPFRSKAQMRFLFSQHPDVARRFAAVTPKGANLPEHVTPGHRPSAASALRARERARDKGDVYLRGGSAKAEAARDPHDLVLAAKHLRRRGRRQHRG